MSDHTSSNPPVGIYDSVGAANQARIILEGILELEKEQNVAKRSSKNKKIRLMAIAAALSTGGAVIALLPSANAAGGRHFIHIATHGAPLWSASALLYDGTDNQVYSWFQDTKSGGRALWYYTDGGDGGSIAIKVSGTNNVLTYKFHELDRDQCFLVKAGGDVKYTGDSLTGGCNSD